MRHLFRSDGRPCGGRWIKVEETATMTHRRCSKCGVRKYRNK